MSQVSRYLEAVRQRVIVFDGAMGTMIQNLGLTAADYGGESLDGSISVLRSIPSRSISISMTSPGSSQR